MTTLPSPATMYRALCARDVRYDGAFVAGIATTGIFCRPGCGAKKPRRENVRYFATVREALADGFRPCRRCRPLDPSGAAPDFARAALALADGTLDRRLGAADLRAAELEPGRVDRWFKKTLGLTFQGYHRARRMGAALAKLRDGGRAATAPYEFGYASESGFRDAFAEVFGAPPTRAREGAATALVAARIPTPLGRMLALADDAGVRLLEFEDRRGLPTEIADLRRKLGAAIVPGAHPHLTALRRELDAYFAGTLRDFATPVVLDGSTFERLVWEELRRIPYGATRSYAEQAAALGKPKAVRAVGRANGRNKLAIVVPCHRVRGKDGKLVGYAGGLWRKERLLALEAAAPASSDAAATRARNRRPTPRSAPPRGGSGS
jgi:AraC family transcriptional regulator of adaptative response/methylated-DNA-[protein]-cysteine methyltransferase